MNANLLALKELLDYDCELRFASGSSSATAQTLEGGQRSGDTNAAAEEDEGTAGQ